MQQVVRYGDIRRPPRSAEAAADVLSRLQAALPRLAAVEQRLSLLHDDRLAAQAALVRYTQAVLEAVRQELVATLAGGRADATERYAAALQAIANVEGRFKGLWGAVDLPIIHSFYTAVREVTMTSDEQECFPQSLCPSLCLCLWPQEGKGNGKGKSEGRGRSCVDARVTFCSSWR